MKRRLYFLFPDTGHARASAAELESSAIPASRMHLVAGEEDALRFQRADRIARIVWRANLGLFALATLALAVLIWQGSYGWALLPLLVMLLSFFAGERFTHLPDVELGEFRDALHHGEVLLMVDVPRERVAEIEHRVTGKHPEAVCGGVGWYTDLLPH